jgi:HSP20 family protein
MAGKPTPFTDIEELFEEFVTLGPARGTPALDVVEADEEVTVVVDLPGRDPDHIDVSIEEGRRLTIETGQREKSETGRYITQERTGEAVSRTVPLPTAVDDDKTTATYDAGVLTITLPKEQADEGTQIPVE